MSEGERGIEAKVGAFVFVGLAALAALVVQFGRIGEGWKTYYPLTVRFADASGLLKGSDVLLAGAKIGRVSGVHIWFRRAAVFWSVAHLRLRQDSDREQIYRRQLRFVRRSIRFGDDAVGEADRIFIEERHHRRRARDRPR